MARTRTTYPFQLPTTLTASPGLVHRKSTCSWKGLRTRELVAVMWAWSAVQEGPWDVEDEEDEDAEVFECGVGREEEAGTDDAVAALIWL